ncbi:hypothetical protein [Oceanobacillus neutriphilus]|uniref:Uncharacterized protein n=1 Tax=Oceanobacillus neutriphilus TaxID=531815 RepID=A0ABQ2P227_9BACI|nr:hypothetical protein [Oceanobacillus neutriphilus]GGP16213.1 hypothetical protein GCM10011346_47290 [Oceanobacillus neutriphilus]
MKCKECGKSIDKPIVEKARCGLATYFECKDCLQDKYINDEGVRVNMYIGADKGDLYISSNNNEDVKGPVVETQLDRIEKKMDRILELGNKNMSISSAKVVEPMRIGVAVGNLSFSRE